MNKKQLAQRIAKLSRRSLAIAADDIDELVYRLLKSAKRPFGRKPNQRSAAALAEERSKHVGI